MKVIKIKKVFSVSGRMSRERTEKGDGDPKEYQSFSMFIAADDASEAFAGVGELGKQLLEEYGAKGFDTINVSQSFTNWRMVVK